LNEELPLLIRGGFSYEFIDNVLSMMADCQKIKNQDIDFFVGCHYKFLKYLDLRAGMDCSNDAGKGFTFGFGVNILDKFGLDYAYVPYNDLDASHKLTLSYYFGAFSKPALTHVLPDEKK